MTIKRLVQRPSEELYDLIVDPYELNNLAGDARQTQRLESMRADLSGWMKEQGDKQTVFGTPLMIGEPVTLINPGAKKKANEKAKPAN